MSRSPVLQPTGFDESVGSPKAMPTHPITFPADTPVTRNASWPNPALNPEDANFIGAAVKELLAG